MWVAFAYITNRGKQNQAQAWSAFFQAYERGAEVDRLTEVAESYADTEAGLWALQSAADVNLAEGTQDMFRDREQARAELEEAEVNYTSVAQRTNDPLLKQRAMFGQAQSLESMGNFGAAEQKYQEVAEQWPASGVGQLAQRRLEMLQRPATREWYAWFAEQEPAPSPLADPSLFNDLPSLPESPNISLPQPGELIKPSGESPAAGGGPAAGGLQLNLDLDDSLPPMDLEGPSTAPTDDVSPVEGSTLPEATTTDDSVPEATTTDDATAEGFTLEESPPDDPAPGDDTEQTPPTDAADTP